MNVTFLPSVPRGTVAAPPSKSMTHRYLICAGCSPEDGESLIRNAASGEDVLATIDCLTALGADCRLENGAVRVRGTDVFDLPEAAELPCRESGSTLRFLLPMALLTESSVTMTGTAALLRRPLTVYKEICNSQSLTMKKKKKEIRLRGPISPGGYHIPCDISSQFASGLLLALPLLEKDSLIELLPPVESRAYVEMTLDALEAFGVRAHWKNERVLLIPGGQRYQPCTVTVEGDWSNAAFFLALGVPVEGLRADSLQGDKVCADYFQALDAGPAELDIADCPDLGPLLMAYAAARRGGVLTGTHRLTHKESDRGRSMAKELAKLGAEAAVEEDRITVGPLRHPPERPLCGHNDHRIVMALSVLCVRTGGVITGAEAVDKSFPDFFDRLTGLGVDVTAEENSP